MGKMSTIKCRSNWFRRLRRGFQNKMCDSGHINGFRESVVATTGVGPSVALKIKAPDLFELEDDELEPGPQRAAQASQTQSSIPVSVHTPSEPVNPSSSAASNGDR